MDIIESQLKNEFYSEIKCIKIILLYFSLGINTRYFKFEIHVY